MDSDFAALRVLRISASTAVFVRMVSANYGGLITHWFKGRSHLCQGEHCSPLIHKQGSTWKGYTGAEYFDDKRGKWLLCVLEISEGLELDLRGVYRRGQIWELWRAPQSGKKSTAIVGKLTEDEFIEDCPDEFSILGPIHQLYHSITIDLTHKNPMPSRVFVLPREGKAPSALAKTAAEAKIPESFSFAEEAAKRKKRSGT